MIGPAVLLVSAFFFSVSGCCAKLVAQRVDSAALTSGLLLLNRGVLVVIMSSCVLLYNGLKHRSTRAASPVGTSLASDRASNWHPPTWRHAIWMRLVDGVLWRHRSGLQLHALWPLARGVIAATGLALFYAALPAVTLPQAMVLYSTSPAFAAIVTATLIRLAPSTFKRHVSDALAGSAVPPWCVALAICLFATGSVCTFVATSSSGSVAQVNDKVGIPKWMAACMILFGGTCGGTGLVAAKFMVHDRRKMASKDDDDADDINRNVSDDDEDGAIDLPLPVDPMTPHWVSVAWWQALFCIFAVPIIVDVRQLAALIASLDSETKKLMFLSALGTFLGQSGTGYGSSRSDTPAAMVSVLISCDSVFDFFLWQPMVFANFDGTGWRFTAIACVVSAAVVLVEGSRRFGKT